MKKKKLERLLDSTQKALDEREADTQHTHDALWAILNVLCDEFGIQLRVTPIDVGMEIDQEADETMKLGEMLVNTLDQLAEARETSRLTDQQLDYLRDELTVYKDKLSELRGRVYAAMNELGIPGEGYPAPVANAHAILSDALDDSFDRRNHSAVDHEVDIQKLYSAADAQVWAREFMKVCPQADESLMLAWFANAMCTALDRSDLPKWREAARLTDEYAGLENKPVDQDSGGGGETSYQGLIYWRPGWSLFDVAHAPGEQYEEDLRVWRDEQKRMRYGLTLDLDDATSNEVEAAVDAVIRHKVSIPVAGSEYSGGDV